MPDPVSNYELAQRQMTMAAATANRDAAGFTLATAQVLALLAVADAVEHLIRATTGTYDAFKLPIGDDPR